jgi:hypothetical protein
MPMAYDGSGRPEVQPRQCNVGEKPMKMRAFLIGVPFVVATGCTPLQTSLNPVLDCRNSADCRVQVTVNCGFGKCGVVVQYDTVLGKRNGDIVWEMQNASGQSYSFDRNNGIVFPTAPTGAFDCHEEANGARYSCKNRGDAGKFKYTINVAGSPPATSLDPWVVN